MEEKQCGATRIRKLDDSQDKQAEELPEETIYHKNVFPLDPPAGRARPLDQGLSNTCTCHAIANAIADQLCQDGVDINQGYFANILINYNQHIGKVWPHIFNDFNKRVITMDRNSKKWLSIHISVVKSVDLSAFDTSKKYVLAYFTRPGYYHCVFIKRLLKIDQVFECVNSWGDGMGSDPYPKVEFGLPGNMIWMVQCEWELAPETPVDNEELMLTVKYFFVKIDLIGEMYVEDYKDKSSKSFSSMAQNIREAVDAAYSESKEKVEILEVLNLLPSYPLVESVEGPFRCLPSSPKIAHPKKIMHYGDGIIVEFAMSTNSGGNITPLRDAVLEGKLGNFNVKESMDIREASLDTLQSSISSVYYTINNTGANIDEFTEKLFQEGVIDETDLQRLETQQNPAAKSKYFHQLLVHKCGEKGYESVLDALQAQNYPQKHDYSTQAPDSYPMKSFPKGIFLLINNKDFLPKSGLESRKGADVDAHEVGLLFHELGFHVREYTNVKCFEIMKLFQEVANIDHSAYSVFAACVMSHGGEDFETIYGTDKRMSVSELFSCIAGVETLAGKPKFFLMQYCRGYELMDSVHMASSVQTTETDIINTGTVSDKPPGWFGGRREEHIKKMDAVTDHDICNDLSVPREADLLIAYSTAPGFYTWQNNKLGSWFIQAVVKEFRKNAHKTDVVTMLTSVNRDVAKNKSKTGVSAIDGKRQVPSCVNQLRYNFFLRPTRPLDNYTN